MGDTPRRVDVGSLARRALDVLVPLAEEEQRPLHPFRPRTWDEVPSATRLALQVASTSLEAARLFVIPSVLAVRGSWRRRRRTPTLVLAFADDAVVLWSSDEGKVTLDRIPIGDVLAVDDRTVLLYGRLTVIGTTGRIAVQYNATAREQLCDNVLALRRRIAGEAMPASDAFVWQTSRGTSRSPTGLPHKWWYVLTFNQSLRLDPGEPSMVAAGDVLERGAASRRERGRRPATGLSLLGARELVIAAEPAEHLEYDRYGVDLTAVPRRFVRGLHWERGMLRIELRGPDDGSAGSIVRPLDRHLVDAMRLAFGDAVRWS